MRGIRFKNWFACIAVFLLISACGGGDGDGGGSGGASGGGGDDSIVGGGDDGSTVPIGSGGLTIPGGLNPDPDPDPTPDPTPVTTGLDSLFGSVTFNRTVFGDSEVFSFSVPFSSSSVVNDPDLGQFLFEVISPDNDVFIGCFFVSDSIYLCDVLALTDGTGAITLRELLVFELTSATSGSGVAEICVDDELIGDVCFDELLNSPDAALTVSISSTLAASPGSQMVGNVPVTAAEAEVFLRSAELEFGGLSSGQRSEIVLDPATVELMRNSLANRLK